MQTVRKRTLHATKRLIKIAARVLFEPVEGTLLQTVRKRTLYVTKVLVKVGARAYIEPLAS